MIRKHDTVLLMGITFDACHKLTQQKNFGFIQTLISKEKEKTKIIVKKRLSQQDKQFM